MCEQKNVRTTSFALGHLILRRESEGEIGKEPL